jgi:dCMP deaminase
LQTLLPYHVRHTTFGFGGDWDMAAKRTDYITWDEYFMAVAQLSAHRSKDPSTQVGACIVNSRKRIIGIGYNGFPTGCSDDELPWEREGVFLETKYPYVCHAELNAITNATNRYDLEGATLYVSLFPCNECAKLIVQAGIKEVVFLSDKYSTVEQFVASRRIMTMAGVTLRQLESSPKQIVLSLEGDGPAAQ